MADSRSELTIIAPGAGLRWNWRELWQFRELFVVLAWRDVSVRYKQAVLGILWTVLKPIITMVVFTIVFGRIAGLSSQGGIPYPLLVFAALLPWSLFSTAFLDASNSLAANANLVGKIYFPRVIVVGAAVMAALIDFVVSLFILVGLFFWYGYLPGWQIIFLPFFIILTLLLALGGGLYFSVLTAKYRDFRVIVPFAVQAGLYISPVGFSSQVISEAWRPLFSINPLVGIIEGFRWCILRGNGELDVWALSMGISITLLILVFGLLQFLRNERSVADVI